MSADIINLRMARKRKARENSKRQAEERSIEFGRSKAQKTADRTEISNILQKLEAHRLDRKP